MATKTWYINEIATGGTPANVLWWDDGADGVAEATANTGFLVAKSALNTYANLSNGTANATGFTTTIVPNATAPASNGFFTPSIYTPPDIIYSTDSIATLYEYNGYFPAGNWVFTFPIIATNAGANDIAGRINLRVFRGIRSGTAWASVTELTSALQAGTSTGNFPTDNSVLNSVVTWAAPVFELQNEFLILKIGWQILNAGGNANRQVQFRYGSTATMVTPEFQKQRAKYTYSNDF
jgi:hypothetical protein